jgi:PAS domain S-box-containing protein
MTQQKLSLNNISDKFDFLTHFANDLIFLMDEAGNILDVNDVVVKTFGWSLVEILSFHIRDLRDPSTHDDLAEQLKLVSKTGDVFETRYKRRDGSTFPAEVTSRLFEYEGKKYRQSIARDITQRLSMVRKLGRDAKRFQGLLNLNDLATKLPEKEFMQAGLQWVEDLTASKIAFIHFVNDDQETIELVAWSRATQEKYCTAGYDNHYPASQAGIWADCLREHKAVVFNDYESYPNTRGLPEGHSTLNRLISVPVIEGDKIRVILGVGNKQTDYNEEDIEIAKIFGNDMWRIIRRQRLEKEVKNNLLQQIALNKSIEEAQRHLLQSEKMASLGQLAAGVAHELNNPIGFVYSNMGTLEGYLNDIFVINAAYEESEKETGQSCPALDSVHKLKLSKDYNFIKQDIFQLMTQSKDGLMRMKNIVQDLKDFSHVGEESWKWFDLHKGLDSTLNIVWNELKYKCQIHKEYGTLPDVYCMPSQINQVFLNLLVNAGQAIETKGDITIRSGVSDDEVWVEVEDTGKGIEPGIILRIFDPFFTTKPVGKGTGLGLSLTSGIMQKHKGRIEVKSEVGTGTAMRMYLPIKPANTPHS